MRVDLPYLEKAIAKGRVYYYYRRGKRRVPIRGSLGSPDFLTEYHRIHEQFSDKSSADQKPVPGSMRDLIVQYKNSERYEGVELSTRKDYIRYLDYFALEYGHLRAATLPRPFIFKLKELHKAKPRKAQYLLQVLRILMQYAVDLGWRKDNPASRPGIKANKKGGHRPWEEDELAPFRKHWALGTVERTAFELMLNTAQRGSDVVKVRWSHILDGMIRVRQLKTDAMVWIPISLDLQQALEAWKATQQQLLEAEASKKKKRSGSDRDDYILVGEKGRRLSVDWFRHIMAAAYGAVKDLEPGLARQGVTSHGLRFTAATILREIGCDWEEIAAITGHETVAMVRKYSGRKRKAKRAIAKLDAARLAND